MSKSCLNDLSITFITIINMFRYSFVYMDNLFIQAESDNCNDIANDPESPFEQNDVLNSTSQADDTERETEPGGNDADVENDVVNSNNESDNENASQITQVSCENAGKKSVSHETLCPKTKEKSSEDTRKQCGS
jgi:hypothetical protein